MDWIDAPSQDLREGAACYSEQGGKRKGCKVWYDTTRLDYIDRTIRRSLDDHTRQYHSTVSTAPTNLNVTLRL